MADREAHLTISTRDLRPGGAGRVTVANGRRPAGDPERPSFAASLADAGREFAPPVAGASAEGAVVGGGPAGPPTLADAALAAALMADAQAFQAALTAAATASAAAAATTATATATAESDDAFLDLIPKAEAAGAANGVAAAGPSSGATPVAALKEYPRPARGDRSGVLSWTSTTPPAGRELERLVTEARHRRVGWVALPADPEYPDDYVDVVERLAEVGIQPIVRIQDPEGDLPTRDVRALVQTLKEHGVTYFQLFDGPNVAAETPNGRVDVRAYADRWLAAARAVVEAGGAPGVGALAAHGDFDDLGFMRQLLSAIKERGGADVLGRSWLALRAEAPGASATPDDVDALAQRAAWFDRLHRRELGRSLPILVTGDPPGRPERLTPETALTAPSQVAIDAEGAIRDRRRRLPALFGASRGTLAPPRPPRG